MEENSNREKIMKVWKDYIIKDVIALIEKSYEIMKPKIINTCWRKFCPNVGQDSTRFTTDPVKEIMK